MSIFNIFLIFVFIFVISESRRFFSGIAHQNLMIFIF